MTERKTDRQICLSIDSGGEFNCRLNLINVDDNTTTTLQKEPSKI